MASEIPAAPLFLTQVYQVHSDPANPVSLYTESARTPTPASTDDARPYVTLTFAQSLDAKIAGIGGKQLALSGKESLVMTHWWVNISPTFVCENSCGAFCRKVRMRTMHDAILVGIGTALNDDPQLNTRHLPPFSDDAPHRYHCPRPIILDTHLRLSPDSKLLKNFREGTGRRPWVFSIESSMADPILFHRERILEDAGAKVIKVLGVDGLVSIPSLLETLRSLGVRSLMVEGGARVIQTFLAASERSSELRTFPNCVNMVIVTVAPTLVGNEGVGYGPNLLSEKLPILQHLKTELCGRDVVMALKVVGT
ncbi:uncharacterized protein FIBRA_05944 [Fibroporia radiculosa]|uniref:2,5-diamino-6-ribosylamino-4(3H)-pyrimidinone 5'-phosphate reductase n=1 Tax=Fibroporia radiculosa TaxID=599839 RepID=J4IB00_9APHY|nr:uncharacterized protein FIBRA_05944 [Fibroporia radiculosa]CCM03796.1 predicted protein [Fibroporia radiculosa]